MTKPFQFIDLISYERTIGNQTDVTALMSPSGRFATLNDKHSWIFECGRRLKLFGA